MNLSLTITQMPEGGFLVTNKSHDFASPYQFLYASTTIDEALKFIRDAIIKAQPAMANAKEKVT